jgi:hypothetical protein
MKNIAMLFFAVTTLLFAGCVQHKSKLNNYGEPRIHWSEGFAVFALEHYDNQNGGVVYASVNPQLSNISVGGDKAEGVYMFRDDRHVVIIKAGILIHTESFTYTQTKVLNQPAFMLYDGFYIWDDPQYPALCDSKVDYPPQVLQAAYSTNPYIQAHPAQVLQVTYCFGMPSGENVSEWKKLYHQQLTADKHKMDILNALRMEKAKAYTVGRI